MDNDSGFDYFEYEPNDMRQTGRDKSSKKI